ncbi:alpha/beta hydrolase family domain-containing protein [Trichoderma breve]|uniref:Alpha/beta hydrolase family domain-containing protein n=1 Tax=Trichoderma breve TaxID=2034170 RepID=A0A9W9BG97_9HYPO|nr:alpha/beta hydrolase family domain-containing protein [Trichoderma breve]KAJ4859001.1 alpha/beta hydrolase family domain-containing protein [Trichoderma breve]
MASSFRVIQHTVKGSHTREYIRATANGDADTPRLSVKQYIPLDNPTPKPGDVTIIGAHANGFPKELYEPLWEEIYQRASQAGIRIRSIWIADMWSQGQSGVLNEKILGNDPSWTDNARDLMYLINQKQDDMPHPIVGIGHSMGGTQLALLSLGHPRLLRSLVFIDPVIQVPNSSIPPAMSSTSRQDIWPSKDAATSRFKGSKFFQSWDPRVLDLWIEYGLRQAPTELYPAEHAEEDKRFTLTTSKHQELFTFLRPSYLKVPGEKYVDKDPISDEEYPGYPLYRPEPVYVFRRLPELRPSILYIFGDKSNISLPEQRRAKMALTGTGVGGSGGAAAGRVKQVTFDCGHLVPMEKVTECAIAITAFLGDELERWRREKAEFEQYWNKKSRTEQITIDKEWARKVDPKAIPAGKTKL